jgi:glyoxylase-like metal-dependent hydrolase (beta-lactamase superfamily II)
MSLVDIEPLVQPESAREIAPGVIVIPDHRVNLVPNIGILVGTEAVLVVDSGLGRENGKRVLAKAKEVAGSKQLFFTTTHFHPEHAFGAQEFKGHATFVVNKGQADELQEKGPSYLELFKNFGPSVEELLEGVEFAVPDQTYQGERAIDLGGKKVVLREFPGHTRSDQVIFLPQEKVLFTGDLVDNHFFPILDADSSVNRWIDTLTELTRLSPRTVVPGHGDVGTVDLVREIQDILIFLRGEVDRLVKEGRTLESIDEEAAKVVEGRYRGWENGELMIPMGIRSVYAELTGTPFTLEV